MANVDTARNVWLAAKAAFEEWRERFERGWIEPDVQRARRRMLEMLPPEALREMKATDPERWQAALKSAGIKDEDELLEGTNYGINMGWNETAETGNTAESMEPEVFADTDETAG